MPTDAGTPLGPEPGSVCWRDRAPAGGLVPCRGGAIRGSPEMVKGYAPGIPACPAITLAGETQDITIVRYALTDTHADQYAVQDGGYLRCCLLKLC